MVFANAKVLLPLLAALTALATPAYNVNSGASLALEASVESDPAASIDATLDVEPRSSPAAVTPMTSAQVDVLTPYTYYTRAGYCNSSVTKTWTCGASCDANPGFRPIASGGDGSNIQYCP